MAYQPYQYDRYPSVPGYYPGPVPDQLAQLRQNQVQPLTMPSQAQPSAAAPMMTPPTIHAEIVQVDGEAAATQYPVGAGMSQMMIARDESAIFIKTATANGHTMDVFDKRPPAPKSPLFNPDEYVRIDALPGLIAAEVQAAVSAIQPPKPSRSRKDQEVAE